MIWVGLECSPPQPRLPQIFGAIAWIAFHCISSSRLCIFQWASYAVFTEKLHSLTDVLCSGDDWCKSFAFFSEHSGTGSAFPPVHLSSIPAQQSWAGRGCCSNTQPSPATFSMLQSLWPVSKAWWQALLQIKLPVGHFSGRLLAREWKEKGDGATGTVAKSLGSFCEWPHKHHTGTAARGVEVLVDDDRGFFCVRRLCSVLYIQAPRQPQDLCGQPEGSSVQQNLLGRVRAHGRPTPAACAAPACSSLSPSHRVPGSRQGQSEQGAEAGED